MREAPPRSISTRRAVERARSDILESITEESFAQAAAIDTLVKPAALTLCARIPILPGQQGAAKTAAEDGALDIPGSHIHFARLVVIEEKPGETPHLMVAVIFDEDRDHALDLLVGNAAKLELVLQCCAGYVSGTASNKAALRTYLEAHEVDVKFLYPKYWESSADIEHSLRLRQHFLGFLRAWQLAPNNLPALYQAFFSTFANPPPLPAPPAQPPKPVFDPHRTNTLNMVHPLKPGKLSKFNFRMLLAQFFADLGIDSLPSLNTLHFARIALIRGDTMLFASAYDGDFLQYVLDFGSRVGNEIDQLWNLTLGYPANGTKDLPKFVQWLESGRYAAQAFHTGHHPATVLEISASTRLREKLESLVAAPPPSPPKLAKKLRKFVRKNQELLS